MSVIATPRRYGGPSRSPVMLIKPAFGLHDGVVAGLVASRAGLAVPGNRAVDQPWKRCVQGSGAKSRGIERSWPEVLDEHIRRGQQLLENGLTLGLLEIERQALLVAIDAEEIRALSRRQTADPNAACRRRAPDARS